MATRKKKKDAPGEVALGALPPNKMPAELHYLLEEQARLVLNMHRAENRVKDLRSKVDSLQKLIRGFAALGHSK